MLISASPMQSFLKLSFIAMLAAAMLSSAIAADPKQKNDFENRLASVKALSSALARDAGAGNQEVKTVIASVAARQREAEDLAAIEEYEAATVILNEGYKMLTRALANIKSGTGYAAPSPSVSAELAGDGSRKPAFERIAASARALFKAAQRASAESGGARAGDLSRIEATIGLAEQAGRSGDFVRAEGLANDAMKELRPLLAAMKGTPSVAPVVADKKQDGARALANFDARMDSAKALVAALKRLNQEKAAGRDAVIVDIDTRLQHAAALRGGDLAAARVTLDEAYNSTKVTLQSMQEASGAKTGSAALEGGAKAGAGADTTRGETDRLLKSSGILRDALERIGREKGVDVSAALSRIDALSGEARSRMTADPARALQAAQEANQTAKEMLTKLR